MDVSELNVCGINVLSVDEASEILDRVYPRGVPLYAKLHKMYTEICAECRGASRIRTRNKCLIKKISKLGVFLYLDILEATRESDEFNEIVTKMLCLHRNRCINLDEFKTLDKSFLNWVSHRSSYMGHNYLGITMGILQPMIMELTGAGDLESIENASKCYKASYDIRRSRHPGDMSNPVQGVCREAYSGGHEMEKRRDRIISDMLARWVYELNKM